ncbi:hypothetical protein [Turicimonas muris]|jgi:CO dehydrogenase/acetyl-CoA synthase beta subunit|uniref:hypothetical protein n=1 Tax=Turicimonas muris TaxID=1796652 RepID=UPI001EB9919E|nr:hypothetical protein [Turicimonas muris]MBS4846491.1 hypothetical protein [Burkholderiales bacterium]
MERRNVWDSLLAQAKKGGCPITKEQEASFSTRSNFVLKGNTAVDLGENPEQSFLTFSESPSEFDGGVYLVGKDVNELSGSQPLALQLNVVGCEDNDELLYLIIQNLKRELQVKDVMVKGSANKIWLRFSKKAIEGGMDLFQLGSVLLFRLQEEFTELSLIQILFVTETGPVFDTVRVASEEWNKQQEALKAAVWDKRGFNFKECHVLGHCGKCSDKKLCANVRKVERILTLKRKEKGNE